MYIIINIQDDHDFMVAWYRHQNDFIKNFKEPADTGLDTHLYGLRSVEVREGAGMLAGNALKEECAMELRIMED